MSLVQEILYTISNYPGGYRILYDILYDGKSPAQSNASFKCNLRNTLSRMKRNGLLINNKKEWLITLEGRAILDQRNSFIKKFPHPEKKKGRHISKNLIIIFDIPETKRGYRDWLRVELVGFGFEQVQKSVWFGPPLPKEFIKYLNDINLLKYVKFFRATENDLI